MDLFVINRYTGENNKNESTPENEEEKLQKIMQRIERNKKLRLKQKTKEQQAKERIQKTLEIRQQKREKKAQIVSVPENDAANEEFVDNVAAAAAKDLNIDGNTEQTELLQPVRLGKKRKRGDGDVEGFTILGDPHFNKKVKVKRVLPKWLMHPTVIPVDLREEQCKVSDMKMLDKDLRTLLKQNGIRNLFPVQAQVIPWLLATNKQRNLICPRDVCVSAPTGSGKTLAFVLPVVQALKGCSLRNIRALAILPTQDLAIQVFRCFKTYTKDLGINVCLITGSVPFAVEQQQLISENSAFGYVSKVDILICTAGRLVDHLKMTKGFSLHNLEFLIIDEADRVLDNLQNDWLHHLHQHLNAFEKRNYDYNQLLNILSIQKRQQPRKLLFSATLSQDPEKLQKLSLFQPKLFTSVVESDNKINSNDENKGVVRTDTFIGKYTTPKELTEKYIVVDSTDIKPLILYKFILNEQLTKTIIFTHSIETTHRLKILLDSLFANKKCIEEVSSILQTEKRKRLIEKFQQGQIDFLICTDAFARGIDLTGVQCVISYSAPKYLKTYIHRAGRTARAGEKGLTVTILNQSEVGKFKNMIIGAGKNDIEKIDMSIDDLETLGELYKNSLQELKDIVAQEEKFHLEKLMQAKGHSKKKRKNTQKK